MQKLIFCVNLWIGLQTLLQAQPYCSPQDHQKVKDLLQKASNESWQLLHTPELIVKVGKTFLGTPYVANTLEVVGEQEELVVNMQGLDCTTFLENTLVFTRLIKRGQFTFDDYLRELEYIRYRKGVKMNYASRLHYFSEWLVDHQYRGTLVLPKITQGKFTYEKPLNFISTNRDKYAQLSNDQLHMGIVQAEKNMEGKVFDWVPKEEVKKYENMIETGDILAITTSVKGLDVVHVGFAIHENGRLHLLHASSANKKVEVTKVPLSDYLLNGSKIQTGLLVARLR